MIVRNMKGVEYLPDFRFITFITQLVNPDGAQPNGFRS